MCLKWKHYCDWWAKFVVAEGPLPHRKQLSCPEPFSRKVCLVFSFRSSSLAFLFLEMCLLSDGICSHLLFTGMEATTAPCCFGCIFCVLFQQSYFHGFMTQTCERLFLRPHQAILFRLERNWFLRCSSLWEHKVRRMAGLGVMAETGHFSWIRS